MSQMIEMHSADHCVVVAELATSLKDVKFSKQRPDRSLDKVKNILKGSLDLIPSPSTSVKIQIRVGKV